MHAAPRLFALTLLSSSLLAMPFLSGCSDDSSPAGGGGSTTTLNATPSLGKVMNAAVEARCLATGTVIGSGTTGTSGTTSFALTAACAGPVIVELAPNGGTTYYDEKLGTTAAFTSGALRTLLPSVSGSTVNVAITPLTEIATRQALQAAGNVESAITPTQINTANSAVGTQVFGSLATGLNILQPPTVWDSSIAAGALGTSSADRYALLLAGLAGMASAGSAAPALDVANALATDLQDGTLSGATTTGFTYTAGNFATQRTTALNTFATYASSALQAALGISTGGSDTTAPTLASSTPADGATGVAVGADLVLTFSEAVVAGSGNIVISNGTDTRTIAVTDTARVTFSGSTVTVNPSADLTAGSAYNVQMAAGVIQDPAGNDFAGIASATTLNFNTASAGGGGSTGVTTPSGHNISSTTVATYLPLMSNPNGKIINYDEGTLGVEIYDYVDTLNVSVGDSNPLMSITINSTYNACALNPSLVTADTPSCSSMGITFSRSTGQVSFANTPMKPIFGTCAGASSCTINGSLAFTPY